MRIAALGLLFAALLPADSNLMLTGPEALQLCQRITQLMESTGAAVPELQLATAPLVAGAKNTLTALTAQNLNAAVTEHFARQTRAFLAVADATPKPFPFSDSARKQFEELRDDAERLDIHLAALIAQKEADLRTPDPDNLKRYAEANGALLPPSQPRVVFLGDSITDFWRLNEYFTGRDFVNRGISGQVTSQMLGRFKADVIDLHPKAVFILAGTNDIGRGTPLAAIENNILMMAELAKVHQIKVLIASVLPTGTQQQSIRPIHAIQELNNWILSYCLKEGCVYVDYYTKMRESTGLLQPDLADDGLHPNSKGYRIMAPIAQAAIDQALGAAPPPAPDPSRKRRVRVF